VGNLIVDAFFSFFSLMFQPKVYDVFLSFRGEDSRAKFMSHLCSSLQNEGIHSFKDDNEIQRGDQISISLLRAIGQSRVSIIVLSTNYANSRWCMLELEKIMEIVRTKRLIVVPVFYEVDPSEVRHQKGRFGKAFKKLISKISVDESTKGNWRRDLFDIGGIAGFVLLGSRLLLFSLRLLFVILRPWWGNNICVHFKIHSFKESQLKNFKILAYNSLSSFDKSMC